MEFTVTVPAATPSKLWRSLAAVALAAGWAASPAYALSECEPIREINPPPTTPIINPDPEAETECRVDISGPVEGPPIVTSFAESASFESPTAVTYLDVCGSWGLGTAINNEITFAELEYYTDTRASLSTVVILTAARVNGTPSLVVDVVSSAPRGWSLTNPANQLPPNPLITIPLGDCKDNIAAPFLGSPVEIKLVNNRIKIRRDLQTVTWPSSFSSPSMAALYPGSFRVMRLRSENANKTTVARTHWTFTTK